MRWLTHSERADVAFIILLALVARVVFCFLVYPHLSSQFWPGDGYDIIAGNLVQGNGFVLDGVPAAVIRLPLYPALLAASFLCFGNTSWPWQLAQCVGGAITCALVLTITRQYASRAGALAAAGLCGLHPTLVLYVARPFTETLYIFLFLLLARELSQPTWRAGNVGIFLGLQLLTRSTALLHLLAFVPALVRRRFGAVACSVGIAGLVTVPWSAWNLTDCGHPNLLAAIGWRTWYRGLYVSQRVSWTTPNGDLNLDAEGALERDFAQSGVTPAAGHLEREQVAAGLVRAWIVSHPRDAIRLWIRNIPLTWFLGRSGLSMWVYLVLHGALLFTMAVGAVRIWRECPQRRDFIMAMGLLVVGYTAFHAVIHPGVRYILPVVPLAALLAAGATVRPSQQ